MNAAVSRGPEDSQYVLLETGPYLPDQRTDLQALTRDSLIPRIPGIESAHPEAKHEACS